MIENVHYESHVMFTSSAENTKENDGNNSVTLMPSINCNSKFDKNYPTIPSSCLKMLEELGEGMFGKVHLASFRSDGDTEDASFLVAVSIFY